MLTSKELKERKSECLSHYENETEIIVSMPVDELIDLLENQEKLTQAINILKDKLVLDIETETAKDNDIELTGHWLVEGDTQKLYTIITKKEFELLKEVFGNDN